MCLRGLLPLHMLHVAANSFLGYLKLQARPNSPVLCNAMV
jgi:hypothetical protein